MPIRKAIIPVAGLGTRFLPATKAQPKEMLTLVDKPVIQYIVEELVASGITDIIFVTSQSKRAIEDHFDTNFELEVNLEERRKLEALEEIRKITRLANFAFVRQDAPRGDGHAILSALPFVDPDEAVVVSYGDDVFRSERPVTAQLIDVFEKYHDPVIALYDVGAENVASYGIASGKVTDGKVMELDGFVEKPAVGSAPSSLAAVGRYVITPDVIARLREQQPSENGEIRLADAFVAHLKKNAPIYGCLIDGLRYDCGNKLELMKAAVDFALHHEINRDGAFADFLVRKAEELKRAAK